MIQHGDDTYKYKDIRLNFSSNVYNHFDHRGLFAHLASKMPVVCSYPEPEPRTLERRLAERLGVPAECVLVSNGATEAIYLIAQAFADCHHDILQPTFAEYAEAVRMAGAQPFSNSSPSGEVGRGASPPQNLIWLCNPNNPTGEVREMAYDGEGLYVIDQSYECYTTKRLLSAREAVERGNILLLHSMTKEYGIPGLRLGYVVGAAPLIQRIRERRMPWSVSALAIEAGLYLLEHDADYSLPLDTLLSERQRVAQVLVSTGKIDVHESDTHILLCRLHDGTASDLKEALATRYGILIRDASNFMGLDASYFRVAMQLPHENNELIEAIKAIIKHNG